MDRFQRNIGETVGLIEPEPKIDWIKWVIIIGLLALLGVNIFNYLGQITDWFAKIFRPIVKKTVGTTANVVGDTAIQTIDTTAKGTSAIVGNVAKGTTSGINELQKALNGDIMRNNIDNRNIVNKNTPENSLVIEQNDEEADTSIVGPKTKGLTSGFCYIGEDRGNRACIAVGQNDKCMSGEIYPTMEVCVNPNLRP